MNTNNAINNNGTGTSRIIPLTCSGHTRPVVDIQFSDTTPQGKFYLISACKGMMCIKLRFRLKYTDDEI